MGERGPARSTDHLTKRGRIWYCEYYDLEGNRHRKTTGCTDRKAAEQRLAAWEREAVTPADRQALTLNDCLHQLLEDKGDTTTEENCRFLQTKSSALLSVFDRDLLISCFERDSSRVREYVKARRSMRSSRGKVKDATIRRELGVLRQALEVAKSRGQWSGDLDLIVPPDFVKPASPAGDKLTRIQAQRLFAHLTPDVAAAVAFILATGAEMSAVRRALRDDLSGDLSQRTQVAVRGTKNRARHAKVSIVTDEQRLLLRYTLRYAQGHGGKLFGNLHSIRRDLKAACLAEGLVVVSPHDLRRSAGQWFMDIGIDPYLVSKFLRHTDISTTERYYASVRSEDLPSRMLAQVPAEFARAAPAVTDRPKVQPITAIPEPRSRGALYEHDGRALPLATWAASIGVAKTTLHYRVVTCGMPLAEALRVTAKRQPRSAA